MKFKLLLIVSVVNLSVYSNESKFELEEKIIHENLEGRRRFGFGVVSSYVENDGTLAFVRHEIFGSLILDLRKHLVVGFGTKVKEGDQV